MKPMDELAILVIDDNDPKGQRLTLESTLHERLRALGADNYVTIIAVTDPPAQDHLTYFEWALGQVKKEIAEFRERLIAVFSDLCLNGYDYDKHEGLKILQTVQQRLPDCKRFLMSGKVSRSSIPDAEVADEFISLTERRMVIEEQIHDAVESAIRSHQRFVA